jgi:hypothetical protein
MKLNTPKKIPKMLNSTPANINDVMVVLSGKIALEKYTFFIMGPLLRILPRPIFVPLENKFQLIIPNNRYK